jgi:hypothetical protein
MPSSLVRVGSNVYNRFMWQVFKWLIWTGVIVFLLLFNNLLGTALGRLGRCNLAIINNGVHLYTSCRGDTAYLISHILDASAITVGDNILTPNSALTPQIRSHELAHVRQYHILGPAFLPAYACAELAAWVDTQLYSYHNLHDSNIFEFWANSISPSLNP